MVSAALSPEALLMTDGASIHRKVTEGFAGHEFVYHGSDEFARRGWDGDGPYDVPAAHEDNVHAGLRTRASSVGRRRAVGAGAGLGPR